MSLSSDRRTMLTYSMKSVVERAPGPVRLHDLATNQVRIVEIPGTGRLSLSADGSVWASGETDGAIWAGRTDGGEPHLLLGHVGPAWALISGDRRWVVSSGEDTTLRLWPMPDLSKPPLHTLPREELIAKLKSLTNLRAVRDEGSSTGWKIEVGPFPGWETVPTW
jgi:WD40 repeat protein